MHRPNRPDGDDQAEVAALLGNFPKSKKLDPPAKDHKRPILSLPARIAAPPPEAAVTVQRYEAGLPEVQGRVFHLGGEVSAKLESGRAFVVRCLVDGEGVPLNDAPYEAIELKAGTSHAIPPHTAYAFVLGARAVVSVTMTPEVAETTTGVSWIGNTDSLLIKKIQKALA